MLVGVEKVLVSGQLSQCHIFKKLLKTCKSVMICKSFNDVLLKC